jgi:CRISPR system Cascade subunit CasB
MSGFIEWLEKLNKEDTRVRAVLRRSLSFGPGVFPAAYPYVEPFLKGGGDEWRREVHYLVAGLWAQHWRDGRSGNPETLSKVCFGHYMAQDKSTSIERRFVSLLDADQAQLPYRLRQMVAMLREYPLDFGSLLNDLLYWLSDGKRTQNNWARAFYRDIEKEEDPVAVQTKEEAQ